MSDWHDELRYRPSVIRVPVIAIPVIWLAFLLSLFVHLAALWEWLPHIKPLAVEAPDKNEATASASAPIAVRLGRTEVAPAPAAEASAAPARPAVPTPPRATPPSRIAMSVPRTTTVPRTDAPTVPPPPVLPPPQFIPPPAPEAVPPPAPTPTPAPPPIGGDLASYIASRRRARGSSSEAEGSPNGSPEADDVARRDRIVASNLASVNSRNFGDAPKNSGGVFRILHMGYDDAEFAFFGWNRDIKRRANMRIEVRRTGDDVDIRHAIVRKMIAIIREYEVEDFTWESIRLGRSVRLSARQRDNAGLEDFMMLEFFDGPLPR